jgi:hypothetical protein
MVRALQVYLDDADFRALEAWVKERGWTLSQAVRVALKALTRGKDGENPLLAASGMVEGLPADLSKHFDEYLALTYVAEPPVRYGHAKQKPRARKAVR